MTLTPRQLIEFIVAGEPIPQGSAKGFVVGTRAVITHDNARTKPWRATVAAAAADAMTGPPLTAPVLVAADFYLTRPKSVRRLFPSVRPDLDKLTRALLDGLVDGGVIRDDAQVCDLLVSKNYVSDAATLPHAGCRVRIRTLEER